MLAAGKDTALPLNVLDDTDRISYLLRQLLSEKSKLVGSRHTLQPNPAATSALTDSLTAVGGLEGYIEEIPASLISLEKNFGLCNSPLVTESYNLSHRNDDENESSAGHFVYRPINGNAKFIALPDLLESTHQSTVISNEERSLSCSEKSSPLSSPNEADTGYPSASSYFEQSLDRFEGLTSYAIDQGLDDTSSSPSESPENFNGTDKEKLVDWQAFELDGKRSSTFWNSIHRDALREVSVMSGGILSEELLASFLILPDEDAGASSLSPQHSGTSVEPFEFSRHLSEGVLRSTSNSREYELQSSPSYSSNATLPSYRTVQCCSEPCMSSQRNDCSCSNCGYNFRSSSSGSYDCSSSCRETCFDIPVNPSSTCELVCLCPSYLSSPYCSSPGKRESSSSNRASPPTPLPPLSAYNAIGDAKGKPITLHSLKREHPVSRTTDGSREQAFTCSCNRNNIPNTPPRQQNNITASAATLHPREDSYYNLDFKQATHIAPSEKRFLRSNSSSDTNNGCSVVTRHPASSSKGCRDNPVLEVPEEPPGSPEDCSRGSSVEEQTYCCTVSSMKLILKLQSMLRGIRD